MPTGTLCAERNAIGNALAGDQTMCRSHMKGVAVLSIPLNKQEVPTQPQRSQRWPSSPRSPRSPRERFQPSLV